MLDTLSFPEDELRELRADYKAIMALLERYGLTDLDDHDAFFDLFYDEDIRFEFMLAFKKLTRSLDLVLPAKEALDYLKTYNALTEINVLAGRHLNDQRLSMKGIPPKLRALTDQYLASKGIDQKVKPISILDEDFERKVAQRKRTKTKAAEVEHAIRHHLDVELDDDPELKPRSRRRWRPSCKPSRTTGSRFTKSWRSCANASSRPRTSRPMACTRRSRCRSSACSRPRCSARRSLATTRSASWWI